jgi:hypothetical protein
MLGSTTRPASSPTDEQHLIAAIQTAVAERLAGHLATRFAGISPARRRSGRPVTGREGDFAGFVQGPADRAAVLIDLAVRAGGKAAQCRAPHKPYGRVWNACQAMRPPTALTRAS